jgi:hypothetical protein
MRRRIGALRSRLCADKLVAAVAEATAPLANSLAWTEIILKRQAAGCAPRLANKLRAGVWLARAVRKASISVQ